VTNKKMISDWFHLYCDDLKHYLIYRMGNADVEDFVQETFIRAIKGLDSFQSRAHPKTWLFSIARNVAIDELRKRKRAKWLHLVADHSNHEPISMNTPESLLGLNGESSVIFETIKAMKVSYRDVVILRGVKELSVAETAEVLNWSESKVRSTYHRARTLLQQKLKEAAHYE